MPAVNCDYLWMKQTNALFGIIREDSVWLELVLDVVPVTTVVNASATRGPAVGKVVGSILDA